jgi:hypothetical protein
MKRKVVSALSHFFKIKTALFLISTIFWDIMLCSPLKVNRHFGGTYCLHIQGRRISQARNQRESPAHPYTFFPCLFFLDQQNLPVSGPHKLLFLSPIGSISGRVRAKRFHSVSRASQWELRSTLPFPSCFLYNPKFPASRLLGLPLAFTLVSCSAYSTLNMEAICSFET